MNGIEWDFLREVRHARSEDCRAVVEALYQMDGREDEEGELTPLGMLTAQIIEELTMNGGKHGSPKKTN